jgi:hypothetical protein
MAEEPPEIHVDDDWKSEARKEKQRLADETKDVGRGPLPAASFTELLNMITMQIMVGLGGFQGPGGQSVPPNPELAKFNIDLLEVLEQKTKGNLTEEESRLLGALLHEVRLRYVEVVTGAPPPGAPEPPEPQEK